jgi:acetyltransferase-like isoleucine patch superfamily enzyme
MIARLKRFLRQPPSRRRQRLAFAWSALVTRFWYGRQLRALGRGSMIGSPLFWTPEYLEVGSGVLVWPGCRFEGIELDGADSRSEPRIVLGDGVTMQQFCHVTAAGRVTIGAGTLISFNVAIQDTDHQFDDIARSVTLQPLTCRPTTIGENCFIGARASIQAGTHLGRHCVVGTNAVVRGVFPDYCVLVGAPARVVKRYDTIVGVWRRTAPDGSFLPIPIEQTADDHLPERQQTRAE